MKNISKYIRTQKKIVLIYLFAILLPLIVVVYLSYNTFTERQISTRQLLESNLWNSGESALNRLENELLNFENRILNTKYFQEIYSDTLSADQQIINQLSLDKNYTAPFLFDVNFNVIYPKTGFTASEIFNYKTEFSSAQFRTRFQRAESSEFIHNNYPQAIKLYRNSYTVAKTNRNRAMALEGLGRSQLAFGKYSAAAESYFSLYQNYSLHLNKAGHPFRIISLLQLYEINKRTNINLDLIPKFLDAYKKLKDGYWIINYSSYNFFISEIESFFLSELEKKQNEKYQTQYDLDSKKSSSYLRDLLLTEFLQTNVKRKIKETLLPETNKYSPQRILINVTNQSNLVSYKELPNFNNNDYYVCGFRWNLDSLQNNILPSILDEISTETGLDYYLSEEDIRLPSNSLSLSFRKFPFPWKMIITDPSLSTLEKETNKEMIIFGLWFGIIILLMFMGTLLIARDIKRESDSMNVKTEFIHNVSHELKTPLSLIRLYGETLLIKENLRAEDKKDALQVITKESERLSHMINNILDFSKIEMGRKEFRFEKGNFANTVKNTLESYRYHLQKKGFKITEEIAEDIPIMKFDIEAIEGLVINILSNTIKYSQENKTLNIKLNLQNNNVMLQFSDKGIGIPSEEMSHIFDRFYRSKQRSGFEARGSGLGLTLVKHVVEAHGGKIKVDSRLGSGTTFTLEFPILKS